MRPYPLLMLLLAPGGCAVVNTAPPPSEVVRLRDVRDQCLMQNAIRLDDGRSDAATVGRAVVAACQPENAAIISAIAGPDGFRQSEIARQVNQDSQQAATQYVLSHRAAMSVRR
jgi:hypothetical protein